MSAFTMISPLPNESYQTQSGASYTADAAGIITGVSPADAVDLIKNGCKFGGNTTERLSLLNFKNTTGATLTASAGSGVLGISSTVGTSLGLVGEATSSSAKTDVGMIEYILPSSYVAGTNFNVVINANYTGSGTLTGASTTCVPTVYAEADAGTQGSNLVTTSAQQITGTAADYAFAVNGSGLVPGQRILIEVSMTITSSSGANTGQINSVRAVLP
jgi:hypothetical protein